MALPTRQNPESGVLEVLVDNEWLPFEQYRKQQIDEAYQNSVKFLRERLGEDQARKMEEAFRRTGPLQLDIARKNLKRAWELGVPLIAGSDAGNLMIVHGPTIQREMELWVSTGIPPAAAIQAATYNAAKALGADNRFGRIRKGMEATFILVDGDPLKDILIAERVSLVIFKGERVNRSELFDQE